jgi:hypothetical protein
MPFPKRLRAAMTVIDLRDVLSRARSSACDGLQLPTVIPWARTQIRPNEGMWHTEFRWERFCHKRLLGLLDRGRANKRSAKQGAAAGHYHAQCPSTALLWRWRTEMAWAALEHHYPIPLSLLSQYLLHRSLVSQRRVRECSARGKSWTDTSKSTRRSLLKGCKRGRAGRVQRAGKTAQVCMQAHIQMSAVCA